jgi:ribonuclease T1
LLALDLIEKGGPFPFRQDNTTFGNRERRLPEKPAGHYREYTVPTPGLSHRGARRVVRGKTGETFYTRDHYRSFMRIDE